MCGTGSAFCFVCSASLRLRAVLSVIVTDIIINESIECSATYYRSAHHPPPLPSLLLHTVYQCIIIIIIHFMKNMPVPVLKNKLQALYSITCQTHNT